MLISSWFISVALLLVQSALCSDVQYGISASEKTPKQLETNTNIEPYKYNHPPLEEITKVNRKEKSIEFNNETTPRPNKSRSRGNRRGSRPTKNTQLEDQIPVKVIYDNAESTPTPLNTIQTTSTSSPVERTTRIVIHRRRPQTSNVNKKIDIRQTTPKDVNSKVVTNTEKVEVSTEVVKADISSVSEFPTRSRGTYFKKRTEPPTPRVKILEEENFVYAHSGNFHYSFMGGDGTKVSSRGELRTYDNDKTGEAVSGNVSYTDKDGNDFSLTYTADENGYRPVGAHLPTPPPIPPAIARALKYIAEKSMTTAAPEEINNNNKN